LIIARQFIFLPQVIGRQALPLLICALAALSLLIPRHATADSTTDSSLNAGAHTLSIVDADCIDFINENPPRVRCGFIDLPVNHDDPDTGKVTLPILIAGQTQTLTGNASEKAILVPGGGGPGASIGFGEPYLEGEYLGYYNSLRAAGFDIVRLIQSCLSPTRWTSTMNL